MTENGLPRLRSYRAEVLAVRHLGPRFIRVTFGGKGLHDFECFGIAPKIKVYIPVTRPGIPDTERPLDDLLHDAVMRTYTVRAYRPELDEVDIDFVVHGEGPAGRWASRAQPGMALALSNAAGYAPLAVKRPLLIGDPSSLPAIMSVLEELPHPHDARIVLRIDSAHERFELEEAASDITRWLETGHDRDALHENVRKEIASFAPDYVWAAGEAGTLTPLRRYVRNEAGYGKDSSHVVGYWRRHSTADVYDSETIARAQDLVRAGIPLTPQDMDELSIDIVDGES